MPLQNRVTPFGDLVAVTDRGLMLGNRGVLHDSERWIVRYSNGRRWLVCQLEFRDQHCPRLIGSQLTVLTPRVTAQTIAAGYAPAIHPPAQSVEATGADGVKGKFLWRNDKKTMH